MVRGKMLDWFDLSVVPFKSVAEFARAIVRVEGHGFFGKPDKTASAFLYAVLNGTKSCSENLRRAIEVTLQTTLSAKEIEQPEIDQCLANFWQIVGGARSTRIFYSRPEHTTGNIHPIFIQGIAKWLSKPSFKVALLALIESSDLLDASAIESYLFWVSVLPDNITPSKETCKSMLNDLIQAKISEKSTM